jgi:hypothetical protein
MQPHTIDDHKISTKDRIHNIATPTKVGHNIAAAINSKKEMEKNDQKATVDGDLKELVTKLTISGDTEELKEILLQNKQLWNIKDWVHTIFCSPSDTRTLMN